MSQVNALIEARPRAEQAVIRSMQNFFKHGSHNSGRRKDVVSFFPVYTELVLIDSLSMCLRLFGSISPLMRTFAIRFSLFNESVLPLDVAIERSKIEDLRQLSRPEFLEEFLPVSSGEVESHSESPPI